jgi:hypothetical protein
MTRVFSGAALIVGGAALFVAGWYVGSQNFVFPTVGELSGVDRKTTFTRDEYTLRYPVSWRVVEIVPSGEEVDVPAPIYHVAFNRPAAGDIELNDCTLEVRTYAGPARPSLAEWAKTVLGVEDPAFGQEVSLTETTISRISGLQTPGGNDLFVEKNDQIFYLTAGTQLAAAISPEVTSSCEEAVNAMLRSFTLK